mmetsp:Transcript_32276/g.67850  ORF Transcript_32276/g.67850 Transcript_32276/m.67850 type:complete len:209 (-) Transcript_32276:185-811(-)
MSGCPPFRRGNTNAVSNTPSHEMAIMHQRNLVIATLNRSRKETPSPQHFSPHNINSGTITSSGSKAPKRTRTKMMMHCPIVLDVNECITHLQIHVPLPLSLHGDISGTQEGTWVDLSDIIPLHRSPDNQCSQVEACVYLKSSSNGNDTDGVISALVSDGGGVDNSICRSLDSDLTRWGTLVGFTYVHINRKIPIGDGVGGGLHGIEIR